MYAGYDAIEQKFAVPLMGNRAMLRTEERNTPRNQLYLLQKAGIKTPKTFKSPAEIDRLAIIKVPEKERAIERAFFYASSPEEYEKTSKERIKQGIITQEALKQAVIEEYVLGAKFNANLFWSPLNDEIDLLGFDRRIQTDLDGVLDLPAAEQLELKIADPKHRDWPHGRDHAGKPNRKNFRRSRKLRANLPTGVPAGNDWLVRVAGCGDEGLGVLRFRRQPTCSRLPLR